MNNLRSLIFVIASLTYATSIEISKTYQIYHSFNPSSDSFSPRGSITLSATATSDGITASVENIDDSIDEETVNSIVKEGNGLYVIKVVDEVTGRSALASVPACEVRRANFREAIELTIGHTGSLLSLSYTPLVSPIAAPCSSIPNLTSSPKFQSQVTYSTSTTGMTIPTVLPKTKPPPGFKSLPRGGSNAGSSGSKSEGAPFGDKEEERKARENQSFLRKYWYIILPLALSTFFSAEEPGPPGGANGRRSAGTGPSASVASASAGTAAASTSRGGTVARERRGKRG